MTQFGKENKVKKTTTIFSEIKPLSVSQSSQLNSDTSAAQAVDDNLETWSKTACRWNTTKWFKIKFSKAYCFTEVIIVSTFESKTSGMQDTEIFVVDSEQGTENLCGVLKVSDAWTLEGQTYRLATITALKFSLI